MAKVTSAAKRPIRRVLSLDGGGIPPFAAVELYTERGKDVF